MNEDMEFELTDRQRACLGLDQVEPHWERVELNERVCVWFDGDVIRKWASCSKAGNWYFESRCEIPTAANRTIVLPKTKRGKPVPFNVNVVSTRDTGSYFKYDENGPRIANYTTQTTYYSAYREGCKLKWNTFDEFPAWLDKWVADTTPEDLAEAERFRTAKRVHVKAIRAGDYFAVRFNRRAWGFGRVLLDVTELRKDPTFEAGKNYGLSSIMGKPYIVKIYHYFSDTPHIDLDALNDCPAFPSQAIMDNHLFYGEYPVIGHRELQPQDMDYLISYGRSKDYRDRDTVYLQWGLIYRETDIARFDKYLKIGNMDNPYANDGNGFALSLDGLSEIRACIAAGSNAPYWNHPRWLSRLYDLRHPKNDLIRRELFAVFGLNPNVGYEANVE